MDKYKGFYIINHQDIGYFAVYDVSASAFNVVQAINLFVHKESAFDYVDRLIKED